MGSKRETFALWRAVMPLRGADDDQVATAERQVRSVMHRRDELDTRALLSAAGSRE